MQYAFTSLKSSEFHIWQGIGYPKYEMSYFQTVFKVKTKKYKFCFEEFYSYIVFDVADKVLGTI